NQLVKSPGTPLGDVEDLDPFEFVRTIAVARILMPRSMVRLSAGREQMDDGLQALCFLAGANSIFYGERLLTTSNPEAEADRQLFQRLGLTPKVEEAIAHAAQDEAVVTQARVRAAAGFFDPAAAQGRPLWRDAMVS
ncbi:MAG: biotin synthase BioB, partial [Perlucidibaca sp.]